MRITLILFSDATYISLRPLLKNVENSSCIEVSLDTDLFWINWPVTFELSNRFGLKIVELNTGNIKRWRHHRIALGMPNSTILQAASHGLHCRHFCPNHNTPLQHTSYSALAVVLIKVFWVSRHIPACKVHKHLYAVLLMLHVWMAHSARRPMFHLLTARNGKCQLQ